MHSTKTSQTSDSKLGNLKNSSFELWTSVPVFDTFFARIFVWLGFPDHFHVIFSLQVSSALRFWWIVGFITRNSNCDKNLSRVNTGLWAAVFCCVLWAAVFINLTLRANKFVFDVIAAIFRDRLMCQECYIVMQQTFHKNATQNATSEKSEASRQTCFHCSIIININVIILCLKFILKGQYRHDHQGMESDC